MIRRHAMRLVLGSALVHGGDEKAGVDSLFRRQAFVVGGEVVELPVVTGNAVRGRWRRVAADRWLRLLGAPDACLPPDLYHALFTGGVIAAGSARTTLGVVDRRELRRLCPYLSLLGCAWGTEVLQGKLTVGHLLPVAVETAALTGVPSDRSVHELMDDYMLTRREDRDSRWLAAGEGAGAQMLYRPEALAAGAELVGLVLLDDATEVEASCLGDLVGTWGENPTLGGRGSGGFGRVVPTFDPPLASPGPFLAHVEVTRAEARAWLAAQGAVGLAPPVEAWGPGPRASVRRRRA